MLKLMKLRAGSSVAGVPGLRGRWALALLGAGLSLLAVEASAQNVLWEDYRGQNNVPGDGQYIGTAGAPKFQNYPNTGAMAPFRALTANPANAARTGTSANINFRESPRRNTALCDRGDSGSIACQHQAMGRVLYALISIPQAGNYTLRAAHDDNLVVELSSDYTNTNYRNAIYDIPVGALGEWTSNDTTFEAIGTFSAVNANSCALIRVYWTNQDGANHNRLQWTTPGGTTEIVPASAFRNPSLSASASTCNGSIANNAITLNKVLGSPRLNANDQFTIQIGTSAAGGTVLSAVTSGAGTGQQASTGSFPASIGTTYYLREVMAAGSVSALSAYTATMACTRNGAAFTPTVVDAALRRWSVSAAANDQIVCAITNTAPIANLSINKSNSAGSVISGGMTTYTIVARNEGPSAANGAVVSDNWASLPGGGLDCSTAAGGTLTCATAAGAGGCPATPTPADLQSGVAITPFPVGGSVTFTLTCKVTATGNP